MNIFNYINTFKRKRNQQFSNNNKKIYKKLSGRVDSMPSCLGARHVRYIAFRHHA